MTAMSWNNKLGACKWKNLIFSPHIWEHFKFLNPSFSCSANMSVCKIVFFLTTLPLFGVPGRVLKPMWAACGQRKGTPLKVLPAHCRAIYKHLGVWTLVQRNLSGALKVSSHLTFFYALKSLSYNLTEITIFFPPINARATYSLPISSSTLWVFVGQGEMRPYFSLFMLAGRGCGKNMTTKGLEM